MNNFYSNSFLLIKKKLEFYRISIKGEDMTKKLTYFFILISFSIFSKNPICEELLYKIRDPKTKSFEFRNCIEKLGEYLSLEIAKNLQTKRKAFLHF